MTATSPIGRPRDEIDTPALLIDLDAFERNLARMRDLVGDRGVAYRPHVKSHKSPLIAQWQLAHGAVGVCCAKLGEAEVMAEAGVADLLITTPAVGPAKIARLMAVARRVRTAIVVDDEANVEALSCAATASGVTLDVVIEIDVGQNRCGVRSSDAAARLADVVARQPGLGFRGLQGYHGRLQGMVKFADRRAEALRALERLREAAARVRERGHPVGVLTGGGTGSSAIDLGLGGLSELQPGSYVFMDTSYGRIEWDERGTPVPFERSLSILATVVSHPMRERAIVDVGWKSASSDSGNPALKAHPGLNFEFAGDEHGAITAVGGGAVDLAPGAKLELLPSHCDTTVNLYDRFVALRGGMVEAAWDIPARGRSQ